MKYDYEYIGFQYVIDDTGGIPLATPAPNQYWTAGKDRHCRNAVSCWQDDGKPGARIKEVPNAPRP